MEEEISEMDLLRSKTEIQKQLLRQDITLRLAENVNSAGFLERLLLNLDQKTDYNSMLAAWAQFLEDFIKLFLMTKFLIDATVKTEIEEFFKTMRMRRMAEQKSVEMAKLFEVETDDKKKKELREAYNVYVQVLNETSPFASLDKFDKFLECLKSAGITDIMTFELLPGYMFKK